MMQVAGNEYPMRWLIVYIVKRWNCRCIATTSGIVFHVGLANVSETNIPKSSVRPPSAMHGHSPSGSHLGQILTR